MLRILLFGLLFIISPVCLSQPSSLTATSADGVEVAYTTTGSDEPALIFVHGWTLDRSFWVEQIRHFSPVRRTVALDLAGHGESGRNRENWSMAAFGQDVAAVVDALGLDRVVLICHSMGGAVVLEASQLLGDRVAGIVLVDAFHDPEPADARCREGGNSRRLSWEF